MLLISIKITNLPEGRTTWCDILHQCVWGSLNIYGECTNDCVNAKLGWPAASNSLISADVREKLKCLGSYQWCLDGICSNFCDMLSFLLTIYGSWIFFTFF